MTLYHIGAGLALASLAGAAALWRVKATKMRRRGRRQARALEQAMASARGVQIARRIGAGNIGVVFEARLDKGWRESLGIIWAADAAATPELARHFSEPVALKLAVFGNPEKRARVLAGLAEEIAAAQRSGGHTPLCPYLALGVMAAPGLGAGRRCVVEVMPLIAGQPLREALDSGALDGAAPAAILAQLRRMLGTVEFLESRGYYSRNLDEDNVIVQPEGAWVRIDFDNASRRDRRRRRVKRARRLCRFILRVLDQVERSAAKTGEPAPPGLAAAREKIQTYLTTLNAPGALAILPPRLIEDIIAEVKSLTPSLDTEGR